MKPNVPIFLLAYLLLVPMLLAKAPEHPGAIPPAATELSSDGSEFIFAYTNSSYVFYYTVDQPIHLKAPEGMTISIKTEITGLAGSPFVLHTEENEITDLEQYFRDVGENVNARGWGGIFYKHSDGSGSCCDWSYWTKNHIAFAREEQPTITSFSPTSAPAGETVTITGTNFAGTSQVTLAGTPVTSFTVVSPTELTIVVPDGASGTLTVTNTAGSVESAGTLTLIQPNVLPADGSDFRFAYTTGNNLFYYEVDQPIYLKAPDGMFISIRTYEYGESHILDTGLNVIYDLEQYLRDVGENVNARGWGGIFYKHSDGSGSCCDWSYWVKDHIATSYHMVRNISVALDENGEASISAEDIYGGNYVNVNIADYAIDRSEFSCQDLGEHQVTLTLTDINDQEFTATATVTIEDNTPPVPDSAELETITAQCELTELTAPTATDNCSGQVTATHDAQLPITQQGTTTVTWTFTDQQGNSSTQTQLVILEDTTPPVPDSAELDVITAQCELAELTAPTANDNCSGQVTATHDVQLPITQQGTTTVTWTFTDQQGNSSTQTQLVTLEDNTPPVPDSAELDVITAQCELTELTPPTATDNCSGQVTATHDAQLPITQQGTTTVTWTFTDQQGNSSTQTQLVTIPQGEDFDGDGLSDRCDPDDDNDGVDDQIDQCPYSPLGSPVNEEGCELVVFPENALVISSIGESCQNQNDGGIELTSDSEYVFMAEARMNDEIVASGFLNGSLALSGLGAGSYDVCLTLVENPEEVRCYSVQIDQPRVLDIQTRKLSGDRMEVLLSGGESYSVEWNGRTTVVSDEQVQLTLKRGANTLRVSTALECQGVYEETIIHSKAAMLHTNPIANGRLRVSLSDYHARSNTSVRIYDISGNTLLYRDYDPDNGELDIDVSSLNKGAYFLQLKNGVMDSREKFVIK